MSQQPYDRDLSITPAASLKFRDLSQNRPEWIRRRTDHYAIVEATGYTLTVSLKYALEKSDFYAGHACAPVVDFPRKISRLLEIDNPHSQSPVQVLKRSEERDLQLSAIWNHMIDDDSKARMVSSLELQNEEEFRRVISYMIDTVPFEIDNPEESEHLSIMKSRLRNADIELYELLEYIDLLKSVCLLHAETELESSPISTARIKLIASHTLKRATMPRAFRAWVRTKFGETSAYAWWSAEREKDRNTLTVIDGSWLSSRDYSGATACSVFSHKWRWPWWVPDTYVINLQMEGLNQAASLHIAVDLPHEAYISSALVRIHAADRFSHADKAGLENRRLWLIEDDEPRPNGSHHYCPPLMADEDFLRYFLSPTLRLVIRPSYHNGLRAGFYVSIISDALLLVLLALIAWPSSNYQFSIGSAPILTAYGADFNSIVAIILIVPTIALTLMIRMDEAPIVKKLHARFRVRLGITALSLFTSAVVFALGLTGNARANILLGCFGVATIASLFTIGSSMYSLWDESRGRFKRWVEQLLSDRAARPNRRHLLWFWRRNADVSGDSGT